MITYHVCEACAQALLNYDFSGLDGFADVDMQDMDTDYARAQAFAETVGLLADAGRVSKPGYWDCECCDQVCIGSASALETLR